MRSKTNFSYRTILPHVSSGMKILLMCALLVFAFPSTTFAQTGGVCTVIDNAVELALCSIVFINLKIVPFLFSLALLFFIYFMVRYFIIDINNADGKEKAKRYAIYSIAGFVLMVSLWGVVNLLVGGFFGTNTGNPVCPDTVPYCNSV